MSDLPDALKMEVSCYSKIELGLSELKLKHFDVIVDVTTKEGMITAIKGRAELRDIRLNLEETRKAEKKFYLEFGKKIDAKAFEILEIIKPMEDYYDLEIKKEESRKESEKQAKLKIENDLIAEKIREEERLRNIEAEKIKAEKDRLDTIEKKKFDEDQAIFKAEKEKFEAEKKAESDRILAVNAKLLANIKEAQDKIDNLERESRLRIENEQREQRANKEKIDNENKARQEEIEKKEKAEKDLIESIAKEELRKKEEKFRQAQLKKQHRLSGYSLLKLFISKHEGEKEFQEIHEHIKEWIKNEEEKEK